MGRIWVTLMNCLEKYPEILSCSSDIVNIRRLNLMLQQLPFMLKHKLRKAVLIIEPPVGKVCVLRGLRAEHQDTVS